jgi:hypothetical protein
MFPSAPGFVFSDADGGKIPARAKTQIAHFLSHSRQIFHTAFPTPLFLMSFVLWHAHCCRYAAPNRTETKIMMTLTPGAHARCSCGQPFPI